jgi:hypothetical protein
VEAIGVDETKWLAAKAKAPTRWASAVVDVERPRVVDLLEGRNRRRPHDLVGRPGP